MHDLAESGLHEDGGAGEIARRADDVAGHDGVAVLELDPGAHVRRREVERLRRRRPVPGVVECAERDAGADRNEEAERAGVGIARVTRRGGCERRVAVRADRENRGAAEPAADRVDGATRQRRIALVHEIVGERATAGEMERRQHGRSREAGLEGGAQVEARSRTGRSLDRVLPAVVARRVERGADEDVDAVDRRGGIVAHQAAHEAVERELEILVSGVAGYEPEQRRVRRIRQVWLRAEPQRDVAGRDAELVEAGRARHGRREPAAVAERVHRHAADRRAARRDVSLYTRSLVADEGGQRVVAVVESGERNARGARVVGEILERQRVRPVQHVDRERAVGGRERLVVEPARAVRDDELHVRQRVVERVEDRAAHERAVVDEVRQRRRVVRRERRGLIPGQREPGDVAGEDRDRPDRRGDRARSGHRRRAARLVAGRVLRDDQDARQKLAEGGDRTDGQMRVTLVGEIEALVRAAQVDDRIRRGRRREPVLRLADQAVLIRRRADAEEAGCVARDVGREVDALELHLDVGDVRSDLVLRVARDDEVRVAEVVVRAVHEGGAVGRKVEVARVRFVARVPVDRQRGDLVDGGREIRVVRAGRGVEALVDMDQTERCRRVAREGDLRARDGQPVVAEHRAVNVEVRRVRQVVVREHLPRRERDHQRRRRVRPWRDVVRDRVADDPVVGALRQVKRVIAEAVGARLRDVRCTLPRVHPDVRQRIREVVGERAGDRAVVDECDRRHCGAVRPGCIQLVDRDPGDQRGMLEVRHVEDGDRVGLAGSGRWPADRPGTRRCVGLGAIRLASEQRRAHGRVGDRVVEEVVDVPVQLAVAPVRRRSRCGATRENRDSVLGIRRHVHRDGREVQVV